MGKESEYDYVAYEKSLEILLEHASKDYWIQYVDINRLQIGVAKNYLWVSAALLGGYFTLYSADIFQSQIQHVPWWVCPWFFAIIAITFAITSFGICLYAMPAIGGYRKVANPSWGVFRREAHELLKSYRNKPHIVLLSSLVDEYVIGVKHNLKTNGRRAKLLRVTSRLLITSFLSAIISFSGIMYSTNSETGEITMNTNQADESNETPVGDADREPDVPPPPPEDDDSGSDEIETHDADIETDKA